MGNLKGASRTEDDVLERHAHVVVDVLAVSFRRPIVSHDGQIPNLLQPRAVRGHHQRRVSIPRVRIVGVGTAHQDEQLHLRIVLAIAV